MLPPSSQPWLSLAVRMAAAIDQPPMALPAGIAEQDQLRAEQG